MAPLRWGIMTAGKISWDFLVGFEVLPKDEHTLITIADEYCPEKAAEYSKTFRIPKVVASYEDIVKDPEVDIVYIGIVNNLHLPLVKLSLDNGKHVLCEKPLGVNVKEAKEMTEYAKFKKLFLMEAIWSRFFPVYQELRKRIDNGSLGDIFQVIVSFGVLISEVDRLKLKELGGGTALDIGLYCVQFALWVFREKPLKVIAGGHMNENGVDQSTSTTLIFSNNRTATLITHSKVHLPNEAFVFGTKKSLKVKSVFNCPTELEEIGGEIASFPLPLGRFPTVYANSVGLHYQCHEVRKCILSGALESNFVSHEETLRVAEICESIRKQIGVCYPQDD